MQTFRLNFIGDLGFDLAINLDDRTQRDVIDHFSRGQAYEHETSLFFMKVLRPGDRVIDVGANAGYFTMLAAFRVGPSGRVLSCEPTPHNAAQVRANARANGYDQIRLEEVAVTDAPGTVVFRHNGATDSNGAIAVTPPSTDGPGTGRFTATADSLDRLAERHGMERVRLLKIDTEGHETAVFRGAERLLREGRVDFIVAELNLPGLTVNGSSQEELRALLLAHGHHAFLLDHDGGLPRLVPPGTAIRQRYTCNILFCRPESLAECWPAVVNAPACTRLEAPARPADQPTALPTAQPGSTA